MRTGVIGLLAAVITAALAAGCSSSGPSRALARDALLARAWSGREPPTTERGAEVATFVSSQIGRPYCWGGTGPSCFDCSGLAQTAWRRVGVRLPRTAGDIAEQLPEVRAEEIRTGDILWWPGHVGIYVGNGWVVDALDSRHGVVRRPAHDPYRAFRPAAEIGPPTVPIASMR